MQQEDKDAISVLFLGTGAADWPYKPGPNDAGSRRLSAALINDHILIDCGPTVPDMLTAFQAPPAAITDVLLTHTHGDHYSVPALECLLAARKEQAPLRLWADSGALERVPALPGLQPHPLAAGTPFTAGALKITPLAANHLVEHSREQALHYLLANDHRQILYATDGAWLLKPTMAFLRAARLDAIIWDATIGPTAGDWRIFEHNSLAMIRLMAETLRAEGVLKPGAQVLLTHLARTLNPDQETLRALVAADGFTPAYDGLRLRI